MNQSTENRLRCLLLSLVISLAACAESADVPFPELTDTPSVVVRQIDVYYRAVVSNPESASNWQNYGSALAANGFLLDARKAYQASLDLDGSDVTRFMLAYAQREDPELALQTLQGSSSTHNNLEQLHFTAKMQRSAGQIAESQETFHRALELGPAAMDIRAEAFQVALELADESNAKRHVQWLMAHLPPPEADKHVQAYERMFSGDLVPAKQDPTAAPAHWPYVSKVEEFSRMDKGLLNLGMNAYRRGEWREAQRWLQILADEYAPRASTLLNLALAQTALQRFDPAMNNLVQAREIEPDNPKVTLAIARILLIQRRETAAEEEYRQLLNSSEFRFDALQGIGRAQAGQGMLESAKGWMERAAQDPHARPEIYEDLAKVCADLGAFSEAKAYVAKAAQLNFVVDRRLRQFLQNKP